MLSKKEEKCFETAMTEMFRLVGRKYSQKATSKHEWYYESTWTSEQQSEFRKWLTKLIRRELRYPAYKADREAGWFVFNFGWKVAPETDKATVPYFARRKPSSEFEKLDKGGRTGRGTDSTRSISSDREDPRSQARSKTAMD
jgi:hypothetical protein